VQRHVPGAIDAARFRHHIVVESTATSVWFRQRHRRHSRTNNSRHQCIVLYGIRRSDRLRLHAIHTRANGAWLLLR
jgi:hypothetical protein